MKATITSWDLAAAVIIIGFILIGIWARKQLLQSGIWLLL